MQNNTKMSQLTKFPEFRAARGLAELGKWASARDEFSRSAQIMENANFPVEAAIANLFTGMCGYYSGECQHSFNLFSRSFVELSKWQLNSPQAKTALRFKLGSSLALQSLKNEDIDWLTVLNADAETRLSLGQIPKEDSGFPRHVWEFIDSEGKSPLPPATHPTDSILEAYAFLTLADMAVSHLPLANSDGRDVSKETELVSRSLKSAERIGSFGPDHELISKWYIGRSLILRGILFEFNANALMAEGMYRAAGDIIYSPCTERHITLKLLASNKLGDLLLKWEKREREGEKLKMLNPIPKGSLQLLNTYIPEPTLFELNKIASF
jgi:hypothetical protein